MFSLNQQIEIYMVSGHGDALSTELRGTFLFLFFFLFSNILSWVPGGQL